MNVKIETKEKFHVINLEETVLSADMTAELTDLLLSVLNKEPNSVILKCSSVREMNRVVAEEIASIQQQFYDRHASFVLCELSKSVENYLDELGLLEIMNTTPTESEAWDIVQMEEIEREFLDGGE